MTHPHLELLPLPLSLSLAPSLHSPSQVVGRVMGAFVHIEVVIEVIEMVVVVLGRVMVVVDA